LNLTISVCFNKYRQQPIEKHTLHKLICRITNFQKIVIEADEEILIECSYDSLLAIANKQTNLPGLDFDTYQETITELMLPEPRRLAATFSQDIWGNLRVITAVFYVVNIYKRVSLEKFEESFKLHFNDNFIVNYINQYDVSLPILYFIPIEFQHANLHKLYEKSFLNSLDIRIFNGKEHTFINYFKPYVIPRAELFLEEPELRTFYQIMHRMDAKLRTLEK